MPLYCCSVLVLVPVLVPPWAIIAATWLGTLPSIKARGVMMNPGGEGKSGAGANVCVWSLGYKLSLIPVRFIPRDNEKKVGPLWAGRDVFAVGMGSVCIRHTTCWAPVYVITRNTVTCIVSHGTLFILESVCNK